MGKKLNWSGKTQGSLTVLRDVGKDSYGSRLWECLCSCGELVRKTSGNLANGVKSCSAACGVATSNTLRAKHGQARDNRRSKVYSAWISMVQRCTNPNVTHFERYGGRGITVCQEWVDSFEAFHNDIGDPPTPKHTLDRIDNDKGYEPGNVRWATRKEQSNNTSSNTWVEYEGKRMTWAQWATYLDVPYNLLMTRVKNKLPLEKILRPRVGKVRSDAGTKQK